MNEIPIERALKYYADLKRQEKEIAARLEELNPVIKDHLIDQKVDKLPTNLGTFTLSERSTWKYSEAVSKLQEKEKATGVAQKVISKVLFFTPPKEEKSNG